MLSHAQHRLRFQKAEIQRLSPSQCLARVQLEQPESGTYVGTAVGASADGGVEGLRVTAQATAAALMQAVGPDHCFAVQDVKLFDAFGQSAVLVDVSARLGERTRELMGFCVAGADATRAAALAVLNAANRVLETHGVRASAPSDRFSLEEASLIREMIATAGARIQCPRCGAELTSDMPLAGGHSIAAVWEFRCDACQRSLIARDLPGL